MTKRITFLAMAMILSAGIPAAHFMFSADRSEVQMTALSCGVFAELGSMKFVWSEHYDVPGEPRHFEGGRSFQVDLKLPIGFNAEQLPSPAIRSKVTGQGSLSVSLNGVDLQVLRLQSVIADYSGKSQLLAPSVAEASRLASDIEKYFTKCAKAQGPWGGLYFEL